MVKFQKRAARLILDRDFDAPSAELFAELNWMIFPERVKFQKAIMMFKSMNNLASLKLEFVYYLRSERRKRCSNYMAAGAGLRTCFSLMELNISLSSGPSSNTERYAARVFKSVLLLK